MTDSSLFFLRHAHTQKDPSQPAHTWNLSERGVAESNELANLKAFQSINHIYVSGEKKTVLTIDSLAKKLGISPTILPAFDEVRRGDVFITDTAFKEEKRRQFENLSYHAFGGESCLDALIRFEHGIDSVIKKNPDGNILIVSHGTILTLYFAKIKCALDSLYERWRNISFCGYGIIENGKIIRDIVSEN